MDTDDFNKYYGDLDQNDFLQGNTDDDIKTAWKVAQWRQ